MGFIFFLLSCLLCTCLLHLGVYFEKLIWVSIMCIRVDSVWGYVHISSGVWRGQRECQVTLNWVASTWELSEVGAGKLTLVLWKSSVSFQMIRLSNPTSGTILDHTVPLPAYSSFTQTAICTAVILSHHLGNSLLEWRCHGPWKANTFSS